MTSAARSWLAKTLAGAPISWPLDATDLSDLLLQAEDEGVVAMVDWQLQQQCLPGTVASEVPLGVRQSFNRAARSEALLSMVFESETLTVLRTLAEANIPGLLLKGTALAYWAYPHPHHRPCGDVDVLVPTREAAESLSAGLCRRGYERSDTSGELVAFELMCRRHVTEELQLEIDVHWRLANSVLFAEAFTFDELMADSIALPALASNARGLGPVHACIHACVHRALHLSTGGTDRLKWLYDIELLVKGFRAEDWAYLIRLCTGKGLAGVVLSGLEVAASTLDRRLPVDALEILREAEKNEVVDASRIADWRYMQRQALQSLPTLGLRVRWVWQRFFPSRAYMQHLYGATHRNYFTLLAIRAARLLKRMVTRRQGP